MWKIGLTVEGCDKISWGFGRCCRINKKHLIENGLIFYKESLDLFEVIKFFKDYQFEEYLTLLKKLQFYQEIRLK